MAFELLIRFEAPDLTEAARMKACVLDWLESRGHFNVADGVIDGVDITLTKEEIANAETVDHRFSSAPVAVFEDDETACQQLLRELRREFGSSINGRISEILDESWQSCWQESFDKFQSEKFFFVPLGSSRATPVDRIRVELISRSGAFGTGQHATTRVVIKALECLIQSHGPRSMLDVGTGTGVYLVAAGLLGLVDLAGTEISEELVDVARENCEIAGVKADIRLAEKPNFDKKFDLVVANILVPVLHEIMPEMIQHLSSRGLLVLAGFIEKEQSSIVRAAQAHGVELTFKWVESGWHCLAFAFKS